MFSFHKNSLAQSINAGGDRVYDTLGFRYTILDNLPLLKMREDNITITASQAEADQYIGDFYGLLGYLKVPVELFWITVQLNNYLSSSDYDGKLLDVLVPSQTEIERIKTIYLSTRG